MSVPLNKWSFIAVVVAQALAACGGGKDESSPIANSDVPGEVTDGTSAGEGSNSPDPDPPRLEVQEPGTHLSAKLAEFEGASDWFNARGSTTQSGAIGDYIDPDDLSPRWSWNYSGQKRDNSIVPVRFSSVMSSAETGLLIVAAVGKDARIVALEEQTGVERWTHVVNDEDHGILPPLVVGSHYAYTVAAGQLVALNLVDGAPVFRSDVCSSEQLIYGLGVVAAIGGTRQSICDEYSGAEIWTSRFIFNAVQAGVLTEDLVYFFEQRSSGPRDGRIASETESVLRGMSQSDGSMALQGSLPAKAATDGQTLYRGSIPSVDHHAGVVANLNPRMDVDFELGLARWDAQTGERLWVQPGKYWGSPAVVQDVFFVVNKVAGRLEQRSLLSGELIKSWPKSKNDEYPDVTSNVTVLTGGPVASENLVFVSDGVGTVALDHITWEPVWRFSESGAMSFSKSGLLLIADQKNFQIHAVHARVASAAD